MKCVKSKCTKDSPNVCTKMLSLHKNAKKHAFFESLSYNVCTLSKAPPSVWPHYQHTHTHNKWKLYKWICFGITSIPDFQSTGQSSHLALKATIWVLAFKKNSTHPYLNQQKLSQNLSQNWAKFQKAQLTLCKTSYAFSHLPSDQGVMLTNLLPVIVSRMEPSYTHIPTSIKMG